MEYIIKNRIDELISKEIIAMGNEKDGTNKEAIRTQLELYRSIKNELTKEEKKTGKEITPEEELKILLKMKSQREDSWKQYKDAGRWDLANKENIEAELLSNIIPTQPTDDDIRSFTAEVINIMYGGKCTMKDMKNILTEVNKKYPSVSGKIVSEVVKSHC